MGCSFEPVIGVLRACNDHKVKNILVETEK